MERNLKVIDFTYGIRDSEKIDTNIPFDSLFKECRTIQQANVIFASYINKNYKEIQKAYEKLSNIEPNLVTINVDITNIKDNLDSLNISVTNLNNYYNSINSNIVNINDNITTINNELININTRIDNTITSISELRQDITLISNNTDRNTIDIDAIETNVDGIESNITNLQTGWNVAEETWTYSSVDDPTGIIIISGDKTSKYSLGMRIKFTNGGNTIYGIVTKIAYSSPNTTLTFLHEIDPANSLALHLMANSAITDNYYSNMKVPFGFPMSADKWSVTVSDTTMQGQSNPSQNIWYNLGGINITIPVGLWEVSYACTNRTEKSTSETLTVITTLSTTNNSESDKSFSVYNAGISTMIAGLCYKQKILNLSSKTIYYLNTRTTISGSDYIRNMNNETGLIIKAECAYL